MSDKETIVYQDLAFEFLDKVNEARTLSTVMNLVDEYVAKFGATHISIFDIDPFLTSETTESQTFHNTWPAEWLAYYADKNFLSSDPIILKSLTSLSPFWWRQALEDTEMARIGGKVMKAAEDFNMKDGFMIPLHGLEGKTAAITLSGEFIDDHPHAGYAMHMIGMYAYTRIKELARKQANQICKTYVSALTPRQLECLKWAALGKSNWEIGEILTISENTVKNHIEAAKTRLNVGRRLEAINLIKGELHL